MTASIIFEEGWWAKDIFVHNQTEVEEKMWQA